MKKCPDFRGQEVHKHGIKEMADEEGRKKEASKVKQTTRHAKQHNTPKAVTFPKEK